MNEITASISIVTMVLATATLVVVSPANADNNVDRSLEKWSEKCDKAADLSVIRKIGTGRYRKNKYTGKTTF